MLEQCAVFLICLLLHTELQAAALLDEGKQKYNNGDKMGALKLFERCLEKVRALGPIGGRASCCSHK